MAPVLTLSYQSAATSATIFLLTIACILITVWGSSLPLWLAATFLGISTVVAAAVALLQSTAIVALLLGLIAIFLGQRLRDSSYFGKIVSLFVITFGIAIFVQSDLFGIIADTTRFGVFFDNGRGEFTSLTSRLRILGTFFDQFKVSPILGHFEAERAAGFEKGAYVHSLPLSFLTHTGVLGTSLVGLILFQLSRSRRASEIGMAPSERRLSFLLWVVFGLGTITSFLTWAPFWFMLGVLCRKPRKVFERN